MLRTRRSFLTWHLMSDTRVTRIESEVTGYGAVWQFTVERHPSVDNFPDVNDIPADVKAALTGWLAGKQP